MKVRPGNRFILLLTFLLAGIVIRVPGQGVKFSTYNDNERKIFILDNGTVRVSVIFKDNKLSGDYLETGSAWPKSHTREPFILYTDANFGLNCVWTDWRAPKKQNNADNPVLLDKTDFLLSGDHLTDRPDGSKELNLVFMGIDNPIRLTLVYKLDSATFFCKRKIQVRDVSSGMHFLDKIMARYGSVTGYSAKMITELEPKIIKAGDFGQPVALAFSETGAFFGLEYPAASNNIRTGSNGKLVIECAQEIGTCIGNEPLESEWVVEALTPSVNVKQWFFKYLDAIRIAPAKPYTLYNSWYDLRSPEYPKVQPDHVMNEKNVMNIIRLFKEKMIGKYGIHLDAFVLDDGWDIYESDWQLRRKTFPHGLKSIADTLKKLGTGLGIWFGPTGGYSFRMKRIGWMKDHGYETVGRTKDDAMLCMGGKNYTALFRKRVTDMVANDGVSYFKWDGIQFSCSEPGHGHPVGIYSRRAIMESVINSCRSVREKNPATYLNITSGTWLSPWWLKYANQIWMDGADYGYADVPVINQRDGAMTYKDFVLYDDFKRKDLWFPISNLMTHGIIKGNLERLGGEDDPLDKFTNDAVFYFARGISMYEFYISPDLLNDGEWNAIAKSVSWAIDRYPVLSNTCMIGGDPSGNQPYGYLHFKGHHGILAIRNPSIIPAKLPLQLSAVFGLDPDCHNLVLEKVYPYHWISGETASSGSWIEISLNSYETAIFEIYPLQNITEPLLSGGWFEPVSASGNQYRIKIYDTPGGMELMNPDIVREMTVDGKPSDVTGVIQGFMPKPILYSECNVTVDHLPSGTELYSITEIDSSVSDVRYAILLRPEKEFADKTFPSMTFLVDGKETPPVIESQKGLWIWYSIILQNTVRKVSARFSVASKAEPWNGRASVYMVCQQKHEGKEVVITTKEKISPRPMPPVPFGEGILETVIPMGEVDLEIR